MFTLIALSSWYVVLIHAQQGSARYRLESATKTMCSDLRADNEAHQGSVAEDNEDMIQLFSSQS